MARTLFTPGPVSTTARWLRGLWEYYRGYSRTAVHAVATAALTGFGLLVFLNPLFVLLAIASYVVPPVILYVLDSDLGKPASPTDVSPRQTRTGQAKSGASDAGGADRDFDSTDSDTDSDDGDTDSDSDDGDADSDGHDADADG